MIHDAHPIHTDDRAQHVGSFADPAICAAIGERLSTLLAEFSGDDTPDHLLALIAAIEGDERAAADATT